MTEPIAGGREADVFALDDDRVLRRYRKGQDATGEARIMAYVAGFGYPVPEVFAARDADLVMQRLTGPTMAEALVAGDLGMVEAARMLADLLAALHELPAWPDAEAEPGSTVLHLDLHPENVMLTGHGPVVIDWHNADAGPADLDTALSALILAQVAIGSIAHPMGAAAGDILDEFLAIAPGDPLRLLDRVVAMRAQQDTMSPAEIRMLPTAAARVRRDR